MKKINSLKDKEIKKIKKEYPEKIKSLTLIKEYQKDDILERASDILKYTEDYKNMDKECFVCFYLNTRKRIIKREVVTIGTLNASLIHPREIFKSAILFNAAAIIISHNHPSGETDPSKEDIQITEQIKKAGEIIDIQLLDHIIINKENKYWSYAENI